MLMSCSGMTILSFSAHEDGRLTQSPTLSYAFISPKVTFVPSFSILAVLILVLGRKPTDNRIKS